MRLVAPLGSIAGLGLATLAVSLRDPHVSGSWGYCPSAALGFSCPGCGGLRAVHDLTHLQWADAASSNLMLLILGPLAVLALGRWVWDSWCGVERASSPTRQTILATVVLGSLAVFTVLRNTPAGAWLAP